MVPRRRKVKGSSPKSKVKKILARWSDGLFYVIKILKVSEMKKMCLVEFEDQSTAHVHFKDLLDEHKEELKACHNCGGGDELENNAFIRCTNCDRDYHRHCHVPPIISEPMAKQFVCRICVFAACAKTGGARDTGPMAARFMFMKREFPYDLEHLSWNPSHTSNTSECYCYCGGPGNFFNKMLQCCRCQQWFHEACIQCITGTVLMGDRFYIFACAHCNYGEEFLKRLDLTWSNLVYVTIFHLSMTQGTKYNDLEADILPFIKQHADSFGLHKMLNSRQLDDNILKEKVLDVVSSQEDIYCCGAKVKKKQTLYGLYDRIPPPPPSFSVPYQAEKISNLTLTNCLGKRTVFKPPKYPNPVPYLINKGSNKFIPSTMTLKMREASMARLVSQKSEHNYCSTSDEYSSSSDSTFSKDSFDTNNNSPAAFAAATRQTSSPIAVKTETVDECGIKTETVDDEYGRFNNTAKDPVQRLCPYSSEGVNGKETPITEMGKSIEFWSLDTAFPEPTNFDGINNPFLTEFELEDLKAQRRHFLEHLEYLAGRMGKTDMDKCPRNGIIESAPSSSSHPTTVSTVPAPVLKNIKGFKGELAKILKTNGYSSGPSAKSKDSSHLSISPEKSSCNNNNNNNNTSPKRLCSSNHSSSHGSSFNSITPNGIRLSPQVKSKHSNRNGLRQNHKLSNGHEIGGGEEKNSNLAVSRCLKKLTPTCGFHFPVLDENHPSIVNGHDLLGENTKTPAANSPHTPRRGVKRKHPGRNRSRSSQRLCNDSIENSQSKAESVRRSHRSRQAVKKFETADMNGMKSYSSHSDVQVNCSILSSATYNVISLRVKDDDSVDYLIDWCHQ